MNDREIFRKNLVDLMTLTKVKQIDISNYIGVSYQTISAWVNGRGYPRADAMGKLCQFFGVKQSVLTEEHTSEKTKEEKVVSLFRSLSDNGQDKLVERAEELSKLYPKGTKKNGKTEKTI